MHVSNRSYLIAGFSALTAGAVVVTPALSQPNIEVPVVHTPVALAASPINTLVGLLTVGTLAGQAAGGGVIGSAAQGTVLYPSDSIAITNQVAAQVQNLIANPGQIPATIVALPTQLEGLTELVEQQSASATAVQNTFTAVASGNPGHVVTAVVSGATGVSKSVFGDSTVPLVTPVGGGLGVVTGGSTDTVAPVKRLGTVTTTTAAAVKGVAKAV